MTVATLALIPAPLQNASDIRGAPRVPVPFARGAGMRADRPMVTVWGDLVAALNKGNPTTPIYSGAGRHDSFMVNDAMLYFLAERDPATYYWCRDSAVTTSEPVQLEMIRELNERGATRVVLWNGDVVDDAHAVPGSHALDTMLKEKFVHTIEVGAFSFLERKP